MAPKRKAPEEASPKKRGKVEEKPEPKGRAKAEPEPKGRAKAAAKAEPEPKGRAKAAAKEKAAPPRATEADLENELNTMIQSAKDGEFDEVFKIIDKYPPYVNERPEERRWSTIHQACYWGELDVVKKLVEKYDADVFLKTKDGQSASVLAGAHGHIALGKYLEAQEKKKKVVPPAEASGRSRAGDRSRVNATRSDGVNDADLDLSGVKHVTLKLGADGGGILCGAALVYSGKKKEKAVCYCDRKFKDAIIHSGDSKVGGKSLHTINLYLDKMPKTVDKVYLTLCACGPANLQKYENPSVELLGDDSPMIRYDLTDAGESQSTIMAVLERNGSSWMASPVGSVSPAKFCGSYGAAEKLIAEGDDGSAGAAVSAGAKASPKKSARTAGSTDAPAAKVARRAASTGGDAAPGYTAAELASMESKKVEFSSWTNAKLQTLLKENDQSRTGNKAALVAKCAFGAAFGKLGRCPKCFGGKVKFRLPMPEVLMTKSEVVSTYGSEDKLFSLTTLFAGASQKEKEDEEEADKKADMVRRRYYCTGYFDDDAKVECDFQADTVEVESWQGS